MEKCEWCGHSLDNNSHGVDQNDFSGTVYLGKCTYCNQCYNRPTAQGAKMDLRCWWCSGTEGAFTSFGTHWKVVHWRCIPKIAAAQHRMHLTAFGAGGRARLGNWLVALGNRISQNGGK